MRTVAIINQKGGCGKTTTSINLAACMARLGNKTLLVDMDPQGHCGVGLAVPEEQIERTIYDCLIESSDGKQADVSQIVWQIASDFDLAPSNIKLAGFEQVFSHRPGRDERLRLALDRVKTKYGWCIIDCPPSVGLLTFNALKACDQVIVPVETGYFSLHGLAKMMETLEVMRNRCGRDILIRILPTLYDTRTKLAREVLSELRSRFKQYLMESTVNFNTKLKEAASFGQPITEYDPGSRGYKDFANLARELMGFAVADAPAAEAIGDQKLSRPAELVQRARQLAQFANAQFNRPTVQPTVPAQPLQHVPLPKPVAAEPPMAITIPVAPLPPVAAPKPPAIPSNTIPRPPVPVPPAIVRFVPPAEASTAKPLRLTSATWPPASELLLPNRLLDSISIPRPKLTTPAPQVKTTEQKIEEFYGVKQVGSTVVFAAHFEKARNVLLAGDFNNWTPQATPMICGERPGDWRKILPLPPGRYKYRLVVDGKWVTDPNNRIVEANQFGEMDNVIEVAKPMAAAMAA
jgi:chromosome partitioning protein